MESEYSDKTKIRIYTDQFIIVGKIAMFPDARLTDYVVGAHSFIAITNATVCDLERKALFCTDFLNVQKEKIVMIMPEEMVNPV